MLNVLPAPRRGGSPRRPVHRWTARGGYRTSRHRRGRHRCHRTTRGDDSAVTVTRYPPTARSYRPVPAAATAVATLSGTDTGFRGTGPTVNSLDWS